jgi:hypothetical protein
MDGFYVAKFQVLQSGDKSAQIKEQQTEDAKTVAFDKSIDKMRDVRHKNVGTLQVVDNSMGGRQLKLAAKAKSALPTLGGGASVAVSAAMFKQAQPTAVIPPTKPASKTPAVKPSSTRIQVVEEESSDEEVVTPQTKGGKKATLQILAPITKKAEVEAPVAKQVLKPGQKPQAMSKSQVAAAKKRVDGETTSVATKRKATDENDDDDDNDAAPVVKKAKVIAGKNSVKK